MVAVLVTCTHESTTTLPVIIVKVLMFAVFVGISGHNLSFDLPGVHEHPKAGRGY